MKRSEMVEAIHKLFVERTNGSPGTDAIGELVDKNPSRFEPEEPRLPPWLSIKPSAARNKNAVLIAEDHDNLALDIGPGHPWWRLIGEAFAAYNREREQGLAAEKLLERYREIVREAIADLEGVLADPRAE